MADQYRETVSKAIIAMTETTSAQLLHSGGEGTAGETEG
jgi:hypothetical protein